MMILPMMTILRPHPHLLLPVLPLMMMLLKVMRLHQMNPALIQNRHRPKANLPLHPTTQTPLILLNLMMIPLKTIRLSYKPPKDAKSFQRCVRKYEKKALKRAKRRKTNKHGGKQSKKSRKAKKSNRKYNSKRSKSYLKKRSVLSMKPWNGHDSFEDTQNFIRNFVDQQPSMHYILSDKFMKLYRDGNHKDYLKKHDISSRQFTHDMRTLHAYLSVAYEK